MITVQIVKCSAKNKLKNLPCSCGNLFDIMSYV